MQLNLKVLFNELRGPLFGGRISQSQVEGLEAILNAASGMGVRNVNVISYMIATAWHESRLVPVREGFSNTDAEARQVVRHRKYGKVVNGHVYYGRGFVQLTWYDNYKKWGIENNPDKALKPEFAAKVLVNGMLNGTYNKAGTGPGIEYYLDREKPDWKNARRTVNILDRWELIKGYALIVKRAIEIAQSLYQPGVNSEAKADKLSTSKPAIQSTTILSTVMSWLVTNGTMVIQLAKEQPILFAAVFIVTSAFAFWIIRERIKKGQEFGI
jgi:putative chitinase